MRILIVTGSSGGHIFPALALLDKLKQSTRDLLLVLPKKNNGISFSAAEVEIKYIHAASFSCGVKSKNILGLYLFFQGAWEGLLIILKFHPDVVVGFGSLNTIGLVFWAWLFRIKTIIHEQNVIAGRANRLLAKLVDKVAVSFAQTSHDFNVASEKIVLTGNPLRQDLVEVSRKQALDFFKFKEGKFNLLITGGSQGSSKLNLVCLEYLATILNKNELQIVHLTGTKDLVFFKQRYAELNLNCQVFEFFTQMQYAYSFADLVICRSGATTIAELSRFKVPAVLIPYPFAYAHQLANAKVLENIGAAQVLLDGDLTVDKLKKKLEPLFLLSEKLKTMREAYHKLPVLDAAEILAYAVLS